MPTTLSFVLSFFCLFSFLSFLIFNLVRLVVILFTCVVFFLFDALLMYSANMLLHLIFACTKTSAFTSTGWVTRAMTAFEGAKKLDRRGLMEGSVVASEIGVPVEMLVAAGGLGTLELPRRQYVAGDRFGRGRAGRGGMSAAFAVKRWKW
jgi:hypothetical protein